MRLKQRFTLWWDIWKNGPTVSRTIAKQKAEQQQILQDSVNTIHSHSFQEHMARCHIDALEAWESADPSRIQSTSFRPSPGDRKEVLK